MLQVLGLWHNGRPWVFSVEVLGVHMRRKGWKPNALQLCPGAIHSRDRGLGYRLTVCQLDTWGTTDFSPLS